LNRLRDYLSHIAEAIRRINSYTDKIDWNEFQQSKITQDAVIRNIEIIGEAGHNILKSFPDFSAAYPQLKLHAAYRMRNAVAHGYFAVDLQIVWSTISAELPGLLKDVEVLMAGMVDEP
jgi:uncharacterized protein with HEPN domain